MRNTFRIAVRNLFRYKRRTILTLSLIVLGIMFVTIFIAVAGSFKNMMIAQMTDSMLGHIQIHRKGYLAAIDNLPQNMNIKAQAYNKLEKMMGELSQIEALSPRIKFGAMFSTFVETTNIRLNGVYPEREVKTVPLLPSRLIEGKGSKLERGEIWIPELMARSMKAKMGDMVVIIATNKDGSVNGKQFKVSGVLESVTGPGGRDGYIHIEDAAEVLRMEEIEISEVAIRIKDFESLDFFKEKLEALVMEARNKEGKPVFEVHSWEKLSPFYNIARMIDIMTLFIKAMLTAIVLISIMNVMIMAVYERIREIGTIAAIGTMPGRILSMFVMEGLCMGAAGAVISTALSVGVIYLVNAAHVTFEFGRQTGLLLTASIAPLDVVAVSGIVLAASILASLQPALKAARMDPVEALGHV